MIIIVLGSQGSGKTLFLTKTAYSSYKAGQEIYSNFKLNFPHKRLEFKDMMACKYNNALIIIDEAHLWGLDARDSHSKLNKDLVKQFIVQVRKQGVILIVATQRPRQIDVRLRQNADIIIQARKHARINDKWRNVIQSENFSKETLIYIELMITHLDVDKVKTTGFIANDYYNLYDTSEVIEIIKHETKSIKKTDKKKIKSPT